MGVDAGTLPASQQARRTRIIEAAMALLDERGYESVQMREVAEAAGVALGTLYRYFPSKEQLYAHVLLTWAGSFESRLRTEPRHPGDAADRLRGALRRAVRAYERHPNHYRLINLLEVIQDPAVVELFTAFTERFAAAIADTLDGLDRDTATTVRIIASGVLTMVLREWASGKRSVRSVDRIIDRTVELVFAGLPAGG